jgi:hypothetical protein
LSEEEKDGTANGNLGTAVINDDANPSEEDNDVIMGTMVTKAEKASKEKVPEENERKQKEPEEKEKLVVPKEMTEDQKYNAFLNLVDASSFASEPGEIAGTKKVYSKVATIESIMTRDP